MKKRESVKLKESIKNTKPEPKDHHQSRIYQNSLSLLATGSLDKQPSKNTHSHMNTNEPRHEKTGFLHMRKQRRRSASR